MSDEEKQENNGPDETEDNPVELAKTNSDEVDPDDEVDETDEVDEVEETELEEEPEIGALLVIGQSDFVKRQHDIMQFVNLYTRTAEVEENQFFRYCIKRILSFYSINKSFTIRKSIII